MAQLSNQQMSGTDGQHFNSENLELSKLHDIIAARAECDQILDMIGSPLNERIKKAIESHSVQLTTQYNHLKSEIMNKLNLSSNQLEQMVAISNIDSSIKIEEKYDDLDMKSNKIEKVEPSFDTQTHQFQGYEQAPNGDVTAIYTGTIIFKKQHINYKNLNKYKADEDYEFEEIGYIEGELREQETLYQIEGKFNTETNKIIDKLITTPLGEYDHLNKDTKHMQGHWDVCHWKNGTIDFKKKKLLCYNCRWKGFKEVLEW